MFTEAYTFYTSRGWEVVPISPHTKKPAAKNVTGRHESPLTPDQAVQYDNCLTALRMPLGVMALDVDDYDDKPGAQTIRDLEEQLGSLPTTWRSGSRPAPSGIYYFRIPEGIKLRGDLGHDSGVEIIQHHHRTAVVLPSTHMTTGKPYKWDAPEGRDKVPSPSDLPELPAPWVEYLSKREATVDESPNVPVTSAIRTWGNAVVADHLTALRRAKDGSRNNELNLRSFFIGQLVARDVLTHDEARAQLVRVANQIIDSDELDSAYNTIESGLAGGIARPREPWPPFETSKDPQKFEKTGFGLADRFAYETNGRVRWVADEESWAVFTGQEWRIGGNMAEFEARKVIEAMLPREMAFYGAVAPSKDKPAPRDEFEAYCYKLRDIKTGVIPTLANARSLPQLAVNRGEFDAEPWKMKVLNGVLDLRTRELRAFGVNDLMTKTSGASFDPDAECPQFLAYLEKVQPDPEVRGFLQRWAGYCLTGLMSEQKFTIHQGLPGTGKSVYLDVFGRISGGYFAAANPDVFHRKTQSQHLTAVASLAGARFIQANESTAGRKLDEAMVNSLVSHEPVVARKMGQDEWTFTPTGKINYVTNHKPGINPTSGVWRRLALVRWNVVIPASEIVQDLGQLLVEEELSGILNWALEGLDDWRKGEVIDGRQRPSLKIPMSMQMDAEEYKADEDWLASFVMDECLVGENYKDTSKNLHKAYLDAAHAQGEQMPLKANSFSKALEEAGYKRYRTSTERGFLGLKVRSAAHKAMVYDEPKSLMHPTLPITTPEQFAASRSFADLLKEMED